MRPFGKISAAAVGPNPVTNPEDVTDELMVTVPIGVPGKTDRHPLALTGFTRLADNTLAAGNVVVQAWAVDESNLGAADGSERVFRKIGSIVTIPNDAFGVAYSPPGNSAEAVARVIPPPGRMYIQVISGQEANLEVHAVLA